MVRFGCNLPKNDLDSGFCTYSGNEGEFWKKRYTANLVAQDSIARDVFVLSAREGPVASGAGQSGLNVRLRHRSKIM